MMYFPGNSVFIVCSDDKKWQFIGTSELLWEGGGAVFMRRKGLLGWGGERRNTHKWFYMRWEEYRGQRLYVGVTTDQSGARGEPVE